MTTATATDWIAPGMTVVIYSHHGWASYTAEVLRLTPTQVILQGRSGELRYRRDTGRQVGDHYGGGELRPIDDPGWLGQQRDMRRRNALSSVRAAFDEIRHDIGDNGWARLVALQSAVTAALTVFDETAS
jgi:hypothetical protein